MSTGQLAKKPMPTKPIFLTYVSLPFDVRQDKQLNGHRPLAEICRGGGINLWLKIDVALT